MIIFFEKHFLVVSIKKLIVFTKQLIVLPLAHLNKVVMNSYAWLQLFPLFQNPWWVKYAFIVPLNQIIKGYILFCLEIQSFFMNGNHIYGHEVDEYL